MDEIEEITAENIVIKPRDVYIPPPPEEPAPEEEKKEGEGEGEESEKEEEEIPITEEDPEKRKILLLERFMKTHMGYLTEEEKVKCEKLEKKRARKERKMLKNA